MAAQISQHFILLARSTYEEVFHAIQSRWGIFTAVAGGTAACIKALPPIWQTYEKVRDHRSLRKRLSVDLYTQQDLLRATEYYIEPDCQLIDPAGQEDFRRLATLRTPAHKALLNLLDGQSDHRFLIILADSGMGKTTLLINLYARYGRPKGGYYLIPLGRPDADTLIKRVQDKPRSILFLDAFDEDTKAIADHKKRLAELVELSHNFSRVVMTCRTQFFETDAEIPQDTGVLKIGPVGMGKSRTYTFAKLYLSPFSEEQIQRYLDNRFSYWQRQQKREAKRLVSQAVDLSMRPLLLSYIPDLINSGKAVNTASQLYEAMASAWFQREAAFVDPQSLDKFTRTLAVDIFCNREARGAESVSESEAISIARELSVELESWQFRGRSMLNRTADGHLKFSHRSLLEYFFALAFIDNPAAIKRTSWTDQIKLFWWEMVKNEYEASTSSKSLAAQILTTRFREARIYGDVSQMARLGLRPFVVRDGIASVRMQDLSIQELRSGGLRFEAIQNLGPLLMERIDLRGRVFFEMSNILQERTALRGTVGVLVDHALGIAWMDDLVKYSAELLRKRRFAYFGQGGWRIPTFAEVATLRCDALTDDKDSNRYPKIAFTSWSNSVWCLGPHGELAACVYPDDCHECRLLGSMSGEIEISLRLVTSDISRLMSRVESEAIVNSIEASLQ